MEQVMKCEHKGCDNTNGKDYVRKPNDSWYGEPIFLCDKHSQFFLPIIKVNTHQNSTGGWYCNLTYNGYDQFTEGETVKEVQSKMTDFLKLLGANPKHLFFTKEKPYVEGVSNMTTQTTRLDTKTFD